MKCRKILAALLCFALLVCSAPIALAAPDTATVTFWYANGSDIQTAFDLTVTDGLAEAYGYTVAEADHNSVPVQTVTVLDVLVAAHKAYYGDAFTAQTAEDYLVVVGGYINKAFGLSSWSFSFTVNDATPHDDTYLKAGEGSSYSGYTGYAADTACVQDGDRICLFLYQDSYYMDFQTAFSATAIDAVTGEPFTVSVSGYSILSFGYEKQETVDENTVPLEGATVEYTQDFETFKTAGTLDENGELSVTLNDAGTFYLVVRGTFGDEDLGVVPVIANFCTVTVTKAPDTATVTFWYANGSDMQIAFDLTVTDGLAEAYGYTVAEVDQNNIPVQTVTVLDVLVAAHKAFYGDAFTAETAEDYLAVSTGFIIKAFEMETSNMGFVVNDATPHDDNYVQAYESYIGYACDAARVQDGDRVCLYMYKDPYWGDILPLFGKTMVEAEAHKTFTVSVSGYAVMYYGCGKQEAIDANTMPLKGMTVEYTQDFKTFTPAGTVGADGKASVKLPEVGTYYLVVRGQYADANTGSVPVIVNFCTVDAKEPTLTDPTLTLASAPEKMAYFVGQTLDTTGLSLLYTDEYGEPLTVTEGFVCDAQTFTEAGTQTFTVTYEGLSVTFDVTVEAVVPVSLKVVSEPTNQSFIYKHSPDFSGLVVSVQYNDGHERIEDDLSKMDIRNSLSKPVRRGTQTYTVTVDGVSTAFTMQSRLAVWQWLIVIFLFGWIWY